MSDSRLVKRIREFDANRTENYRCYAHWKESKWGEDDLDGVEINENDLNFDLAVPPIFVQPLYPTLSEITDSIYSRLITCGLKAIWFIEVMCYYVRNPISLVYMCCSLIKLIILYTRVGYKFGIDVIVSSWTPARVSTASTADDLDVIRYSLECFEDEFDWSDNEDIIGIPFQSVEKTKKEYVKVVLLFVVGSILGTLSITLFLISMIFSVIFPLNFLERFWCLRWLRNQTNNVKKLIESKNVLLNSLHDLSSELFNEIYSDGLEKTAPLKTLAFKWFDQILSGDSSSD